MSSRGSSKGSRGSGGHVARWSEVAPHPHVERQLVWNKCGKACFMGKPTYGVDGRLLSVGFPICPRLGTPHWTDCDVDPDGLRAAKSRAGSRHRPDIQSRVTRLQRSLGVEPRRSIRLSALSSVRARVSAAQRAIWKSARKSTRKSSNGGHTSTKKSSRTGSKSSRTAGRKSTGKKGSKKGSKRGAKKGASKGSKKGAKKGAKKTSRKPSSAGKRWAGSKKSSVFAHGTRKSVRVASLLK